MSALPKQTRAFTLIEMVVSVSIASMILVTAYMCLAAGIAGQKTIDPRAEVIQNARVALAIIGADLRSACALSKDTPFLGTQRTINGMDAGNLDFGTHNFMPRHDRQGDYCQVSYFMDKSSEPGQFSLWRRRNPTMAADPLTGGKREEIAQGLVGVSFQYYDGYDWYASWGELKGDKPDKSSSKASAAQQDYNLIGLPEAVRVTLYFDSEPHHKIDKDRELPDPAAQRAAPMVFQTIVRLELASLYSDTTQSTGSASPSGSGQSGSNPQGAN